MRFIFLSLRDFKIDVGESIRVYGILNALQSLGNEVVFISNAENYEMFHPDIRHIPIRCKFTEKRKLQALLSFLPASVVFLKYRPLFSAISAAIAKVSLKDEPVYFFDYLDNSIGYVLKKQNLITGYINDLHGMVTVEFLNNIKNSPSIRGRLVGIAKFISAYFLDKKVFESAQGLIYSSNSMKNYYENLYNLKAPIAKIIPSLLNNELANMKPDPLLACEIRERFGIKPSDFIFLFVGSFKITSGVDDLIKAFEKVNKKYETAKLLLVGSGPIKPVCLKLANQSVSRNNIYFIDNIPYSDLPTYHSVANVIVCPDKNNPYSHHIVHLKYLDALLSGKLVINGNFKSVKELNQDDFLSLTFEPSDINDMCKKMMLCIEDYEHLMKKYKGTREYAVKNFSYKKWVSCLYNK